MKSSKFSGFGLFEHFDVKTFYEPIQASGYVIFGRDPGHGNIKISMIIPEGLRVFSKDKRGYVVTKDEKSEYWDDKTKCYIVPPGVEFVGILCTAAVYKINDKNKVELITGADGNCKKGEIGMPASDRTSIKPTGCDYWWNSLDFDNGFTPKPAITKNGLSPEEIIKKNV